MRQILELKAENIEAFQSQLLGFVELLQELVAQEPFPAYKRMLEDCEHALGLLSRGSGGDLKQEQFRISGMSRRIMAAPPKAEALAWKVLNTASAVEKGFAGLWV